MVKIMYIIVRDLKNFEDYRHVLDYLVGEEITVYIHIIGVYFLQYNDLKIVRLDLSKDKFVNYYSLNSLSRFYPELLTFDYNTVSLIHAITYKTYDRLKIILAKLVDLGFSSLIEEIKEKNKKLEKLEDNIYLDIFNLDIYEVQNGELIKILDKVKILETLKCLREGIKDVTSLAMKLGTSIHNAEKRLKIINILRKHKVFRIPLGNLP